MTEVDGKKMEKGPSLETCNNKLSLLDQSGEAGKENILAGLVQVLICPYEHCNS